MSDKWLRKGDTVYWEDPDDGLASGLYVVTHVFDKDTATQPNDMLRIENNDSEADVLFHELKKVVI